MSQRRVPRACGRCRKQKLKCDLQRPCTLCERANVECVALPDDRWKHYHPQDSATGSNSYGINENQQNGSLGHKRPRNFPNEDAGSGSDTRYGKRVRRQSAPLPRQTGSATVDNTDGVNVGWNSSSTINLVQEAFHHHLAETPEEADTSAFLATPWVQPTGHSSSPSTGQGEPSSLHRLICRQFESPRSLSHSQPKRPSAAERDLVALLPPTEAAILLIDNYFDRIHWFMLLFHQREFRNKFFYLYAPDPNDTQRSNTGPRSRVGDIAVLLAVMATSLKYTNDSQKDILTVNGVDAELLRNKILTALRLRLLDILSVGTIEVVQTLVLLGSYYLFHGEPELAWPLCGCALRIAQAFNLHRRLSPKDPTDSILKPSNAARKRCWWAVYEIETFCSMLYGFPLSISDADCDVEPLDIYDESSASVIQENDPLQPTLLHYKCAMSTLSALVKSALVDLYGTCRNRNPQDNSILDKMSRLPSLVKKVEALSKRLNDWHAKLPEKLRLGNLDASSAARQHPKNILGGEAHSPIPFEEQVFQLQAFALKLAFENARILLHRPLLSFKIITRSRSPHSASNRRVDPCASAIDTCRDSALQISLIGLCPIVRHAVDTYAAVFMSLHLFTAAVTICIITSLDPLNPKSHECKLGIRRLMEMQTLLKDKSIVASQGLEITKQLMSLALTKEIDAIFGGSSFSPNSSSAKTAPNNAAQVSIPENNVTAQAEFSPVANPLIVPPQTEMSLQPSGTQEGISTEVDPFRFDPASFEFGENPCMTEALLDFGQVINLPTSRNMDNEQANGLDLPGEAQENCFVGQDQGWIWGWEM